LLIRFFEGKIRDEKTKTTKILLARVRMGLGLGTQIGDGVNVETK
jgi:hypothetical protein